MVRLTLTVKVLSSECVTCDSLRDSPRDTLRDTGPFLDIGHGDSGQQTQFHLILQ